MIIHIFKNKVQQPSAIIKDFSPKSIFDVIATRGYINKLSMYVCNADSSNFSSSAFDIEETYNKIGLPDRIALYCNITGELFVEAIKE